MNTYRLTQNILDTQLATIVSLPKIIKENDIGYFKKDDDTSPFTSKYIRTSIVPIETQDLSIGICGQDHFSGLFLIEIFTPRGNGVDETNWWIDEIITAYPKKDQLTDGNITVYIEQYTALRGQLFDNYFKGGVTIRWSAYISR